MIFESKNIYKSYGNNIAINDLNLEVDEGKIFGLLGPNGAGKTSLIRIINLISKADSGHIYINGEELREKHIKLIGYLPEERGLYKDLKIGEQAIFFARLKGMTEYDAKVELKNWFEKLEIDTWWNKKVTELSKGMAQKVQFIISVIHKPKILILDEPFSGFDPINANLLKNHILDLKKNGTTIFFSTHNMKSVEEICDNIALINKSKKILDGEVKQIRKDFSKNIFEVEFNGNMIKLANSLWNNFELIDSNTISEDHHIVKIKIGVNNNLNELIKSLIDNNIMLLKVEEVIPSFDDIFIESVNNYNNSLLIK